CVRVLIMTDAFDAAARAIAALDERSNTTAAAYHAELALRSGRVAEAERYAVEAPAPAVLVCALAERGAYREAHEVLRAHDVRERASLRQARARLMLAEGRFEQPHADARAVGLWRERQGRPNPTLDGWRSTAAVALAHLGRRQE